MKSFPSIDGIRQLLRQGPVHPIGSPCVAFYKYDGSNIRAEWSRKRGWFKFGTRKSMIRENSPFWGQVIPLWMESLAEPIERVLKENKRYKGVESVIAFAEFFGDLSFAGQHEEADPKRLKFFDLNVHKKGFVSPAQFVEDFDGDYRAEVIYTGPLTMDFIKRVQLGDSPRDLLEGVIAKGGEGHDLWMTKIKTHAWIEKVKSTYPTTWEKFHDVEDEEALPQPPG